MREFLGANQYVGFGDPAFVKLQPKPAATQTDKEADRYVVALDFSWTYVQTHEDNDGPHFLRR